MVVKHVYFSLSNPAAAEGIKKAAEDLLLAIPWVKGVKLCEAIAPDGPGRVADYPFFLEVVLESLQAHSAYLQHERHVEFAEKHLKPFVRGELEREFFRVVE